MTIFFVVVTIILFFTIDWYARRVKQKKAVAAAQPAVLRKPVTVRTPEGIYFSPSHTWLNLFPSGKVRLGIDDFVSRMFENPRVTFLKRTGDRVSQGDPLFILEEGEHALTVRSPIECEILYENEELIRHTDVMYANLFSDGWAYTIKPSRFADLRSMMLGPDSRAWMSKEFSRLRDFLTAALHSPELSPLLLQDGGLPVAGALKTMGKESWEQFESQFLAVEEKVKY